jgi:hypothetical protein
MMTDKPEWFANREIVPLLAMTLQEGLPPVKHPIFDGVPSIMQFARTDVQKNIIRKINSTDRLGAAMAFPPGTQSRFAKSWRMRSKGRQGSAFERLGRLGSRGAFEQMFAEGLEM